MATSNVGNSLSSVASFEAALPFRCMHTFWSRAGQAFFLDHPSTVQHRCPTGGL